MRGRTSPATDFQTRNFPQTVVAGRAFLSHPIVCAFPMESEMTAMNNKVGNLLPTLRRRVAVGTEWDTARLAI
jgi:hypothetical protein